MLVPRRIEINNIDDVHIHADMHPAFAREFAQVFFREFNRTRSDDHAPEVAPQPEWVRWVNVGATIASAISALAITILIAMIIQDQTTIGSITITTLLTVFSAGLIGSLLSIGGVTLFSVSMSLRRLRQQVSLNDCPFDTIRTVGTELQQVMPQANVMRPGNPRFCARCPLGIDISSQSEGFLMHTCKVYQEKHTAWISTPEGKKEMNDRGWNRSGGA